MALSNAAVQAFLSVTSVNDAPGLTLSGSVSYVHDTAAITLTPNALVTDVDSPSFDTGQLRVRISTGASATNRLMIAGGFTVDGSNNVLQGTTSIGQLKANGGVGTTDLVVTFDNQATAAIVQALVRTITFKTIGGAAGKRTCCFL